MKLSQKLADFRAEVTVSVPYIALAANATRLQVSTTKVNSLNTKLTDYTTKFNLYGSPATHTEQSVIDINTAYDSFHPDIEALKQQLKHNKDIVLTGTDIATINIHVDAPRRKHVPKPTISPVNNAIQHTHLVVTIFTSNPTPPHQTEAKLPDDVSKIGRKLAVVKLDDPVPTDAKYTTLPIIGTTIYDLVFAPEQVNMKAYLITWYINPTGEEGPTSAPYAFDVI